MTDLLWDIGLLFVVGTPIAMAGGFLHGYAREYFCERWRDK